MDSGFAAARRPGMTKAIHPFLNFAALNQAVMDTSLITALLGAQTGMMQLAVAARLARTDQQSSSSVVKLIDAAQQNFSPLANVAAGIGTNIDINA
jgi:hypothetical protein